ncbi:MAG: hypothetical protein J6J61_02900 [Muribaculaceae bacterium]|nr:hypothetical protein [Muribaculaceae bacterium]
MAYDKLVDSIALDTGLKAIADAIREKVGTSDSLAFPTGFSEAIAAIQTGSGGTGGGGTGGLLIESGSFTPVEEIEKYTITVQTIRNPYITILVQDPDTTGSIASLNHNSLSVGLSAQVEGITQAKRFLAIKHSNSTKIEAKFVSFYDDYLNTMSALADVPTPLEEGLVLNEGNSSSAFGFEAGKRYVWVIVGTAE